MTPATLPLLDEVTRGAVEQARATRPLIALVPEPSLLFFRRAEPGDAAAIHALQQGFVAQGLLLPRSIEQIYRAIRDFVVAVQDGRVVGSAALRIYSADLAEVGALAVAEDVQGTGVGRRLVETLLHDARNLGLRRVFALTLQDGFFHRLGFRTTSVTEFPAKMAADCSGCARRDRCNEIAVDISL